MVSKKKALMISGGSAIATGVAYGVAYYFSTNPYIDGAVVVLTVFAIGYFGMVRK